MQYAQTDFDIYDDYDYYGRRTDLSNFELQKTGFREQEEEFRVYSDFFGRSSKPSAEAFFVATILDTSKMDELKELQRNVFGNDTSTGILSAALLVQSFEDFCFAYFRLLDTSIVAHFVISSRLSQLKDVAQCSREAEAYRSHFVNWFPNNLLRNVARNVSNAKVEWFLLLDVDLVPQPSLYNSLTRFIQHSKLSSKDLYLIIEIVFKPVCH